MSAEKMATSFCVNCLKDCRTYKKFPYCSNRCQRKHGKISLKLSPEAKLLYTIKGRCEDATSNPKHLSKAILRTSTKRAKGRYERNEGGLPREWR